MTAKPTPLELCAYLCVAGAADAIKFYARAFGATLDFKLEDPQDQRISHAELLFGNTRVLLSDEYPDFDAIGPKTLGGSPIKLHLEVDDAEAFVSHAVAEGATLVRPVKLEFHGNHMGMVTDPFGYAWFISSKAEDVSAEEMQARWEAGEA